MRKLVLRNNKATTLTGALTINAATFTNALLTTDIIQPDPFGGNWGSNELVATLDDGTNIEIIAIVMASQNATVWTYTIERGKEGTTARAWAAGAKLEFRLTEGMLQRLAQTSNLGWDWSSLEHVIAQQVNSVSGGTMWATGQTIVKDNIHFLRLLSGEYMFALIALNDGNTHDGEEPDPGSLPHNAGLIFDNTVLWLYIGLNTNGTIVNNFIGQRLANRSQLAYAFNGSITLGNCKATGDSALCIGDNNQNYGHFSTVIGNNQQNFGERALILASGPVSTSGQNQANAFVIDTVPTVPQGLANITVGHSYQACLDGLVWSAIVDFTGGTVWTANTPLQHGTIRRPTADNGRQYIWYDGKYRSHYGLQQVGYSFGVTGTTQPTWPTNYGDIVTDGDGSWACIPNTFIGFGLNNRFLVKEMGIVIHDYQSITAQPFVSLGHLGNQDSIIANVQTILLDGVNKAQIYPIAAPFVANDIRCHIRTLATGTRMIGQFWLRGHNIPNYR